MKGKVAPYRPPRPPSTPLTPNHLLTTRKPNPLSRPLTARDKTISTTQVPTKPSTTNSQRKPEEETKKPRDNYRSQSPGLRTQPIPVNSVKPVVDKMRGRLENYAIGRQLGQGAYAVVRLGTHKITKEKVAIKSYEKSKMIDPHRKQSIKREISILERLNHEHAIRLIETIDSQKHVSLVMEYVGGCSLHGYIKRRANRRIEDVEAKRLFRQVLLVMQYCHSLNVTHRDIKLENILLDDSNSVKLIDFGFSTCMPQEKKSNLFCGTPSYMAPEIVSRREYTGPPVDIWALGVLLFAMLCGCFPFKGINDAELYRKIQKGNFAIPEHVEERPRRLIKRMMQVDPSKRPTVRDILRADWLGEGENSSPQPDPPLPEPTAHPIIADFSPNRSFTPQSPHFTSVPCVAPTPPDPTSPTT